MEYILEFYAKHNDLSGYTLYENGKIIKDHDGHSPGPDYLSICQSSDELLLKIDLETGQILNWDKTKSKLFIDKIKSNSSFNDGDDEEYDSEKKYEEYNSKRPLFEKRRLEDLEYYKVKFIEYKTEIQKYREKFSGVVENGESVYTIPLVTENSPIEYCLSCVLSVSIELMKNNIPVMVVNQSGILYVDQQNAKTARELLKSIGAYKFSYIRKNDDINSLIYKSL